MRLLVDTQCWLWMLAAPERFRETTRARLDDPDSELLLSAASAWEIAIKYALGRLPLPSKPASYIPRMLEKTQTRPLAIEHVHALRVADLPHHHRDPFDRLIVAQAQVERLPIVTADPQLSKYDVEIVDA